MSVEENKKIASSFFENANVGNIDASVALLSDDLVWTGVGNTRFSGTFSGKGNVMEQLVGPLFGSLKQGIHTTINSMVAEGDKVVLLASGKAETHDGTQYNNSYCFIFTITNGKICEVVEYCDTALVDKVFGG